MLKVYLMRPCYTLGTTMREMRGRKGPQVWLLHQVLLTLPLPQLASSPPGFDLLIYGTFPCILSAQQFPQFL